MTLVAVTGATGQVGGRVAGRLAEAGVEQRLVVRDPARAPRLEGASVARAAYGEGDALRRALDGVDVLFLVPAGESADRVARHRAAVDAAAAAGVGHLVYLSFVRPGPQATFTLARDHGATEGLVRGTGLPFTFLRDNLCADFLPQLVGADGVLRGPAGSGRLAAVAQDDVADAAAAVLTAPAQHAGRTYDLTGPQALTLGEVAAELSASTGRQVTYEPETVEQAYASRSSYGAPDWQVRAWVSTYEAIAAGELADVTDDVPRLTGHSASSLADVLRRDTSQLPVAGGSAP